MDKKEYLKNYKKYHYNKTRKIVTFPLLNSDFELLKSKALKLDITTNSLAKELVVNSLKNQKNSFITKEQKELISEYIRVSRGIANNINQIARTSNMGEYIDINILISSLKSYEDEFKKLISKID